MKYMDNNFEQLATEESIQKTIQALKENGISAKVVDTGEQAKEEVLEMLPEGAEVMAASSVTLDTIGLSAKINESGKYDAVKAKLMAMNMETQGLEMQKLGAAPDYVVGSIHAVSEDGHVFIASNTGSQLSSYAYGASHVIWVVSTKKIVKSKEDAVKRIYEHVLPLESDRINKAYSMTAGSNVSKILIINKEIKPDRITIIFVKENLGF